MDEIPKLPPGRPDGQAVREMLLRAGAEGVLENAEQTVELLPTLGVEWEQVAFEARAFVAPFADGKSQAIALTAWLQGYLRGFGVGAHAALRHAGHAD